MTGIVVDDAVSIEIAIAFAHRASAKVCDPELA